MDIAEILTKVQTRLGEIEANPEAQPELPDVVTFETGQDTDDDEEFVIVQPSDAINVIALLVFKLARLG